MDALGHGSGGDVRVHEPVKYDAHGVQHEPFNSADAREALAGFSLHNKRILGWLLEFVVSQEEIFQMEQDEDAESVAQVVHDLVGSAVGSEHPSRGRLAVASSKKLGDTLTRDHEGLSQD